GAEDELRMGDRAVVAGDDEVALEAERLAEPFDHAAGIVVAHGCDHRGFRGLRLLSHRESSVGFDVTPSAPPGSRRLGRTAATRITLTTRAPSDGVYVGGRAVEHPGPRSRSLLPGHPADRDVAPPADRRQLPDAGAADHAFSVAGESGRARLRRAHAERDRGDLHPG